MGNNNRSSCKRGKQQQVIAEKDGCSQSAVLKLTGRRKYDGKRWTTVDCQENFTRTEAGIKSHHIQGYSEKGLL